MKLTSHHIYAGIITFAILVAYLISAKVPPAVSTFEECARYYPVMESYPAQCVTPDGKHFVQAIHEPQEMTVTGEVVCLPHKDTKGPVTLECAFGIKSGGVYYALLDPHMQYVPNLPMGKPITITGIYTKDATSIYDIVGKIEVTSVQ